MTDHWRSTGQCSLRVAIVFFVILVIFVGVAFVFFLLWLGSKQDIGSYQPIRRV